MQPLSPRTVEEFCAHCNQAYEAWLFHRQMFDDNPRRQELWRSFAGGVLARIRDMSHEYVLLQIAKLHDPEGFGKRKNLSIEYIIKSGRWSAPARADLIEIQHQLNRFAEKLKLVRRWTLAHNDVETILAGSVLGEFSQGEDLNYFEELQKLANVIHTEASGNIFTFNDSVTNDVAAFLDMLRVKGGT